MTQELWMDVDRYVAGLLAPHDAALEGALAASEDAGLPPIQVSATQGKLLALIARLQGARSILEIGTLAGYSTIWLARALPADGRLVTLEANPEHAEVARENIARAGLDRIVDVRVGPALETLPQLANEHVGPFDFFFIDADKEHNPDYVGWALELSRPGSVIVVDNVVRNGRVADADSDDPAIQATRRLYEVLGAEPRLDATVIQTVGSKGYDGFALAVVAAN